MPVISVTGRSESSIASAAGSSTARAPNGLAASEINFANARRNPNAQTRRWQFTPESFTADAQANPVIDGRIRKQDCGQISDGAAIVFLANEAVARRWAAARGRPMGSLSRILGWGHRTAPISYQAKVEASRGQPYVFPFVRATIQDAFRRAGVAGIDAIDGIETHDCFTSTEYMAIDHFGITPPGESWRAIESGDIELGGRIPVNPSGGLIGLGHPVGATGGVIITKLLHELIRVNGRYGMATMCIGGGQGITTIWERV